MEKGSLTNDGDSLVRDLVINKILVVSAAVAVTALIIAQFRAFVIGWTFRDVLQSIIVSFILILTLKRKNINTHNKALILIILFSIGGVSGVYTFGMLGGTIFLFPTAAVIVAVFYSFQATLMYIILSIIFFGLLAVKFCSGKETLAFSANVLLTNYSHWAVYIMCIAIFFAVMFVAIHNYRKTMTLLIDKIRHQRDELTKTNETLIEAAQNVKKLSGLLPICASCKKIRDDKGYWNQIELYIKQHSEADFSHSLCPACLESLYPGDKDE